jgi:hypothetical protein
VEVALLASDGDHVWTEACALTEPSAVAPDARVNSGEKRVVRLFDKSEVGAHYRTERGPGSPAGQPRWGGGCDGC